MSKATTVASCLLLIGCVKSPTSTIPSYEQARAQVLKGTPVIEQPVEVREKLSKGKTAPIKRGDASPYNGVVVDEKQAARLAAIVKERDRWRKVVEAERIAQKTKDIIYNKSLEALRKQAQRSWWERHKGEILLGTGAAIGIGIVLGVLYGLTKGSGVNTNTTVHILTRP